MPFVRRFQRHRNLFERRRLVELNRPSHRDYRLFTEFSLRLLRSRAPAEARHAGRRKTIRPEPCAALNSACVELQFGRALAPLNGLIRSCACATVAGFAREAHCSPAHCFGRSVFQRYASSRLCVLLGELNEADGTVCVSEAKELQPFVAGCFAGQWVSNAPPNGASALEPYPGSSETESVDSGHRGLGIVLRVALGVLTGQGLAGTVAAGFKRKISGRGRSGRWTRWQR